MKVPRIELVRIILSIVNIAFFIFSYIRLTFRQSPFPCQQTWRKIAQINDSAPRLGAFDFPRAPLERLGGRTLVGDESVDGLTSFGDVLKAGPAPRHSRQDAEPDFNLIESAGGSRGEVKVHVGMLRKPGIVQRRLGFEVSAN